MPVGAEVEKPPGKIVAELAALIGDVGKTAGRQEACGGEKAERVATIDHGVSGLVEERGDDADAIVVKQ